eukprot:g7710.t1
MTTKRGTRYTKEGWRRGQLESLKLMSKSQAALLRAYAVDRIHERDSLVEVALAFVASMAEAQNSSNGADTGSNGYDAAAVEELLEWRRRLGEETKELDPGSAVDDALSEELKHLRKECRSQARKLEDMHHALAARDEDEDELRSKLRKSEGQYAKLRDLLRDVREELAARDKGGVVPKEEFEHLWQKYDRAKAKIKTLKAAAAAAAAAAESHTPGESRETSPHPQEKLGRDSSKPEGGGATGTADDDHSPAAGATTSPADDNNIDREHDSRGGGAHAATTATIVGEESTTATARHGGNGGNESSHPPPDEGAEAVAPGCSGPSDGGGSGPEGVVVEVDSDVKVEEVLEGQRRLRLELEEANRRLEKAKRGRKAADKEKEALVRGMAKELGDLEQSKDGQVKAANREVARLKALQEQTRRAVRDLTARMESERAAFRGLEEQIKGHLKAMPEVASAAIGAVQSQLSGAQGRLEEVRRQYAREYRERRRLFNVVQELRGNIRVLCRCRPRTPHDRGGGVCVSFPGEGAIEMVNERGKRKAWAFDQVFGLETRQETVYAEVSPLVVSVLDGYNACIFAYGQTGTGKTHTMMGPPSDRGVNARALGDLFTRSAARRGEVDDTITLSILEIYNEHIRDLLIDNAGGTGDQRKLEVRHGEQGNFVPGLTTVEVSTLDEVLRMLAVADKNRASACTNLNDHSSRSHLISSVNVRGVNRHTGATSTGRLHLIDLAGSERISKSGAAGQALREAQNINRSLSALGDVISARASRQSHVPYRNSTLTYLLQDSLSADSKTLMLVCVSPVVQSAEESWCSLNFAARVRTVELGKSPPHLNTSCQLKHPPADPLEDQRATRTGTMNAPVASVQFDAFYRTPETGLKVSPPKSATPSNTTPAVTVAVDTTPAPPSATVIKA